MPYGCAGYRSTTLAGDARLLAFGQRRSRSVIPILAIRRVGRRRAGLLVRRDGAPTDDARC